MIKEFTPIVCHSELDKAQFNKRYCVIQIELMAENKYFFRIFTILYLIIIINYKQSVF